MSMAKENYFVAARRVAIQKLKDLIRKSGKKGVEAEKLIADMQLKGYREKTVVGYLRVLQKVGLIRYEGGDVKRWFIVQGETETAAGTKEA